MHLGADVDVRMTYLTLTLTPTPNLTLTLTLTLTLSGAERCLASGCGRGRSYVVQRHRPLAYRLHCREAQTRKARKNRGIQTESQPTASQPTSHCTQPTSPQPTTPQPTVSPGADPEDTRELSDLNARTERCEPAPSLLNPSLEHSSLLHHRRRPGRHARCELDTSLQHIAHCTLQQIAHCYTYPSPLHIAYCTKPTAHSLLHIAYCTPVHCTPALRAAARIQRSPAPLELRSEGGAWEVVTPSVVWREGG